MVPFRIICLMPENILMRYSYSKLYILPMQTNVYLNTWEKSSAITFYFLWSRLSSLSSFVHYLLSYLRKCQTITFAELSEVNIHSSSN